MPQNINYMTASEWMAYYCELFEEQEHTNISPAPVEDFLQDELVMGDDLPGKRPGKIKDMD